MVELNRRLFRDLDFVLLGSAILLAGFGCVGIYSTSPTTDLWRKQLVFLVVGIVFALTIAFTDYRQILLVAAPFLYMLALLMLALVLVPGFGVKVNGNTAWLKIGSIKFQPSEFAKLAVILMLARHVTQSQERAN